MGNNDHNGEKHYDQLLEMLFEKTFPVLHLLLLLSAVLPERFIVQTKEMQRIHTDIFCLNLQILCCRQPA